MNEIINGDVVEELEKMVESGRRFDLIITSPPYNIKDFHSNHIRYKNYKGNNVKEEVYQEWQLKVLNLLFELLEDEGHLFYNHKNRISKGVMISPYEWLLKTNFTIKQEIVWNQKKGANVDKRRFFPFSERIYWMSKNPDVKIHNEKNLKDVWDVVPKLTRKQSGHPAVMPVEIVQNIYDATTNLVNENKVRVLDPFAGVGSTFIPIINNNNYEFTGIELEQDYIEIFEKDLNSRIKNYKNTRGE